VRRILEEATDLTDRTDLHGFLVESIRPIRSIRGLFRKGGGCAKRRPFAAWRRNRLELKYIGLGENFANRGARSEKQIAVLRALWADPLISFQGRWHTIEEAGINPLPIKRSIPLWIGGYAETTLQRVARFGDGWFPWRAPDDKMRATLERLREYTIAAGRDPAAIGLESQLTVRDVPEAEWERYFDAWRELEGYLIRHLRKQDGDWEQLPIAVCSLTLQVDSKITVTNPRSHRKKTPIFA